VGKDARLVTLQRKMDVSWKKEDLLEAIDQELSANGAKGAGSLKRLPRLPRAWQTDQSAWRIVSVDV